MIKEIFVLIKMILGVLLMWIVGCVYFGASECGKIVVDKVKRK